MKPYFSVNFDHIENSESDFQKKVKERKSKMQLSDSYVYAYTFENELGSEVEVIVRETYKDERKNDHEIISISLVGPKSESQSIVTYYEAVEVSKALNDFLKNYKKTASKGHNAPRGDHKSRWSLKRKRKINCNNPKGFSQKQYCKRKKRGGKYKSNKD